MTKPVPPPPLTLRQPSRIHFGAGCATAAMRELADTKPQRVLLVTSPSLQASAAALAEPLRAAGSRLEIFPTVPPEPTTAFCENLLALARDFAPDLVLAVGGGSVLDIAKLVAALHDQSQPVASFYGIGLLRTRHTRLVCVPTTAGTGSEVSPNALLFDEAAAAKKAVISPFLVPDVAIVDPALTLSLPPALTATTGLDALAHCLEAYTSRAAHPFVDPYALEGVRLIAANLPHAVADGADLAARSAVALGSLYGGLCLGPVNTHGVHALAYPLGGEFHFAHGLSIALLLPAVVRFNASATPARHAAVARALGCTMPDDLSAAASVGDHLDRLLEACSFRPGLGARGIPREALPRLADAALLVTRLLKNNPREVTRADALRLYESAY